MDGDALGQIAQQGPDAALGQQLGQQGGFQAARVPAGLIDGLALAKIVDGDGPVEQTSARTREAIGK